ncbi:MAG: glycosyl hydrolase 2 galactose-binding domain-containing protein, partial [Lachnospiraceae bacterium]
NEKKIFYADNMHRTWRIPVKEVLVPGENHIRIEFLSVLNYMDNYQYAENKKIQYTATGAMKGNQLVRKAHSMFGWDWGPQLPDAGIFRDIYLESWTGRKLEEVRFHQIHEQSSVKLQIRADFTPPAGEQEQQRIRVAVRERPAGVSSEADSISPAAGTATPAGTGDKTVAAAEAVLGNNTFWETTLSIPDPKLWWPNGYGEQSLYDVFIELLDSDGTIVRNIRKTIGLRTLTVSRRPDQWGKEFAFQVNGVKIFAMGADYIPEDCIYSRITRERQDYLLECAKRSHFNCIRVWGGGYYPSDDFYELCNEKGLIVWQDLMFACNVYDATDAFLENCSREIEDNVKRLRHHPCLGLWCGNNEIESAWDHWPDFQIETAALRADYIKLFEHIVPHVVRDNDPDTFFWPSSPSSGGCFANPDDENDGDAHYWDVWHGQKPFTDYRKYFFRFCSEFGFQSFPCLKTVETFTKPEDRNIFSRVMESHQKNNAANGKILYYMSENFRYPARFDDLIYVSQVLQGIAIQYGVEHWRRNRGRCMGTLYWQLNDNWPVASWASIDFFGRWKALQYMACRFYAPTASSLVREGNLLSLYAENETSVPVKWQADIRIKNMDCKIICSATTEGSTGAFCSEKIAELEFGGLCSARNDFSDCGHQNPLSSCNDTWAETVFAESTVTFENGTKTHNVEVLLPYKYLSLKQPDVQAAVTETEDSFVIQLESDVFTPFVELDFADADVIFSDNYFHLTGEPREVEVKKADIYRGSFADAKDLRKQLQIRSLRDTYC